MQETKNNKICSFEKIKSGYLLIEIFNILKENKKLNIIRYNKHIQNKINIDINDYIKEYSKIEIEIIPEDDKYGRFINIPKRNIPHYHIYFNDNKDEQKKTKIDKNDNVKKIKIIITNYKNKTLSELFYCCDCIKKINFIKFSRNDIKGMRKMFCGCYSLKELNISNFNTKSVTDMSQMFEGCSSLKKLNLFNFNTNNVKDMSNMFAGCSLLEELNLSNFNTNNVKKMNEMFFHCSSLEELNLSNFNTNNVTNMGMMFSGCSSLEKLNLSNFNANKVKHMYMMFYQCLSLKKLICSDESIKNQYHEDISV